MTTLAPEKTMRNALGQDVPVRMVKEFDRVRNDLVVDLAARYERAEKELEELKTHATGELEAFLKLSAERYDEEIGGKKGHVTLYSYDGKYRLVRSVASQMVFDEGLAVAQEMINQYLTEITQDVAPEVRMLVDKAFKPNSSGRISTSAVLGLRTLAINDTRWITAMHAISESLKVMSRKESIRIEVRTESGDYRPIRLNFASL
jgi:Protein of unknown function (DUF3164).